MSSDEPEWEQILKVDCLRCDKTGKVVSTTTGPAQTSWEAAMRNPTYRLLAQRRAMFPVTCPDCRGTGVAVTLWVGKPTR